MCAVGWKMVRVGMENGYPIVAKLRLRKSIKPEMAMAACPESLGEELSSNLIIGLADHQNHLDNDVLHIVGARVFHDRVLSRPYVPATLRDPGAGGRISVG